MKRILLVALLASISGSVSFAQDLKLPPMSPTAKISQEFSTSNIEISYSRPSARGRKIFGDVVLYGNVWRTGANAPTKIKFGEDLTVGGAPVKAGEYALYTIPAAGKWEVVINKGTSPFGPDGFNPADDVARFKAKAEQTSETVETFTIDIENITLKSCDLVLRWERTKVTIPVYAANEERLNAAIDKAINKPSIPYQQAASYYLETNQKLDLAYDYAQRAIDQNPQAFYLYYLKARIAKKLGKKNETIDAATRSMELAKGSALEAEYIHNNKKLIQSFK